MPKDANGGTYVEIGALDGHRFSNTRVLSKCHGWRGLLVEANLQNYNPGDEAHTFHVKQGRRAPDGAVQAIGVIYGYKK